MCVEVWNCIIILWGSTGKASSVDFGSILKNELCHEYMIYYDNNGESGELL